MRESFTILVTHRLETDTILRGARGVMVIVEGNGPGDTSSNPR